MSLSLSESLELASEAKVEAYVAYRALRSSMYMHL
jgi:hypothetical protein